MLEVVFEDLEFDALSLVSSHSMIRLASLEERGKVGQHCELVVDSGYSFTYAVPFFQGLPLKHAATRVDVGGKMLTNLLMETLSHKEVNLRGEGHIVNQIKESLSFVSQNFKADLELANQDQLANPYLKEFVLPDYKSIPKGYVRDPEPQLPEALMTEKELREQLQFVRVGSERFTVPEVLFSPSDIGIN
jgi:actin-related protein 6